MDPISETFLNINKIIERESKSSTYKFALLRGTIEIIQESSPFIEISDDRVHIPLGLLIEKWILFYYPIFDSGIFIPQINGSTNLAFTPYLAKVIAHYNAIGGFSVFYNDLHSKGIPKEIVPEFIQLVDCLSKTITSMPMKYIGTSVNNKYYSIYNFEFRRKSKWSSKITSGHLVEKIGTFSIPLNYFEVFRLLGSFINGTQSILFKWAEFSVKASKDKLSINTVFNDFLKHPVTERDIFVASNIYKDQRIKNGFVPCVWTNSKLRLYDIDHVIPFSVLKNNDLWNLLPASSKINNIKRDNIPTPEIIESRKDSIIRYWELLDSIHHERFQREIKLSLIGSLNKKWQIAGIENLQKLCNYLITERGYQKWEL